MPYICKHDYEDFRISINLAFTIVEKPTQRTSASSQAQAASDTYCGFRRGFLL